MRNNRKLIILSSIIALMIGVTAGSYAWFTGKAESSNNTFKAGILGIKGEYAWEESNIDLNNMQPGDTKTYTFTISNIKGGVPSTMDLHYQNSIEDNFAEPYSLLNVAKFKLEIDGANSFTMPSEKNTYTYEELKEELEKQRTVTAIINNNNYIENKDTYTITVTLPEETTNEYQGHTGTFAILTKAKQINGNYAEN